MIVAGWKKGAREIAYLGIEKCPSCKNYDHFALYELATKATLYGIPIAKTVSSVIMACSTCSAAWEVDKSHRDELLRKSVTLPTREYVDGLWGQIDLEFVACLREAESKGDMDSAKLVQTISAFGDDLLRRHRSPEGEYVARRYMASVVDPDKPT